MCSFPGCKRKIYVAGFCNICQQSYCRKHRLPEQHECCALGQYKTKLRKEHKSMLESQQCSNSKFSHGTF